MSPLPPAVLPLAAAVFSVPLRSSLLIFSLSTPQKRKTTTISVEVKKSQHKYIIGPKGNTLQEILEATGVSVEMPPLDSGSETIILRGEPDKLGPALTQVYAKVRRSEDREIFFDTQHHYLPLSHLHPSYCKAGALNLCVHEQQCMHACKKKFMYIRAWKSHHFLPI